jgi:hypothetical protein
MENLENEYLQLLGVTNDATAAALLVLAKYLSKLAGE